VTKKGSFWEKDNGNPDLFAASKENSGYGSGEIRLLLTASKRIAIFPSTEPPAKRSSDELALGASNLAMTIMKPFCHQRLSGILSFSGLLQVADTDGFLEIEHRKTLKHPEEPPTI
jgi:hypothetical protein